MPPLFLWLLHGLLTYVCPFRNFFSLQHAQSFFSFWRYLALINAFQTLLTLCKNAAQHHMIFTLLPFI